MATPTNSADEKEFLNKYKLLSTKSKYTPAGDLSTPDPNTANELLVKKIRDNIIGRNPIKAEDIMWTDDVEYVLGPEQKLTLSQNDDHKTIHFELSGPKTGMNFVLSVHRADDHGKLIPDAFDLVQFVDGNPIAMISSTKGNSCIDTYDYVKGIINLSIIDFARFIDGINEGLTTAPIQHSSTEQIKTRKITHIAKIHKSTQEENIPPEDNIVTITPPASAEVKTESKIDKPKTPIVEVTPIVTALTETKITEPKAETVKVIPIIATPTEAKTESKIDKPKTPIVEVMPIVTAPAKAQIAPLQDKQAEILFQPVQDDITNKKISILEKEIHAVEASIDEIKNTMTEMAGNIERSVIASYGVSANDPMPLSELATEIKIEPVKKKKTKTQKKTPEVPTEKKIKKRTQKKQKIITITPPPKPNLHKDVLGMIREKLRPGNIALAVENLKKNPEISSPKIENIGNLSPSKTSKKTHSPEKKPHKTK